MDNDSDEIYFGIPDEHELNSDSIYGSMRVSNGLEVMVPSVPRPCAECHEPVWVDVTNVKKADTLTILCMECCMTREGWSPEGLIKAFERKVRELLNEQKSREKTSDSESSKGSEEVGKE